MGLFNKKEKKIIAEISKKNQSYHQDIEKEIDELLEDLKLEFQENKIVLEDFCSFITEVKPKLSEEESVKITAYYNQIAKMKSCAKKGIEALNYLAREQRKLSRDSMREYQEYLSQ